MTKKYLVFMIYYGLLFSLYGQNLKWAKEFGGIYNDDCASIHLDGKKFIYIVGNFMGSDSVSIYKLDTLGNVVWSKQFGNGQGNSITTDNLGNVYVTGNINYPSDFDPGPGTFTLSQDSGCTFICKFDSSGNFIWAKNFGVSHYWSNCYSIIADNFGNVYTSGFFEYGSDFDPGPGKHFMIPVGSYDIFISKLNVNGDLCWVRQVGGIGDDNCYSLAIDKEYNILLNGKFSDTVDFDPGVGVKALIATGQSDIFVCKFDSSGNFAWVKQIECSSNGIANAIKLDDLGNIYSAGTFNDTADFDPSTAIYKLTSFGGEDIFVSKLDPNGNFLWARKMGGAGNDEPLSLAVDNFGNAYTTGPFESDSADFDPGTAKYLLSAMPVGTDDVFFSQLDSNGNFQCAGRIGGKYSDYGRSIDADYFGNYYVTGYFASTVDFDPGPGSYSLTALAGSWDVFVCKLNCQSFDAGEKEFVQELSILIYPNPTAGPIEVRASEKITLINITNTLGETVYQQTFNNQREIINISSQPKGIYFVEIIADEKRSVKKIIIE